MLLVFLCVFIVFTMSACKKSNAGSETATSSENSRAYEDIDCVETLDFKQVGFSEKNSNVLIGITMPEQWKLKKTKNGYNIVKKLHKIGSIKISEITNSANESVVSQKSVNDINITHSVECIGFGKRPSYIRTLCYNYEDEHGNYKNLVLTVAYQEIATSAVDKMMWGAEKSISYAEGNRGVLQIRDNRNTVLILGNSFINTSNVGSILQTMCGSDLFVEAHSRGYASVATYAQDEYMLQNIRLGNYSVVFICGFYNYSDVVELTKIVDACEYSNTKIAIFPAHNEVSSLIEDAATMYPNTVVIDWKKEINILISKGIDYYNFCIDDQHQHSTPLAGYVGAHMIYRAVFNEIPQTTSFSQVPETQINLLGDYVSNGKITSLDENSIYVIE